MKEKKTAPYNLKDKILFKVLMIITVTFLSAYFLGFSAGVVKALLERYFDIF